VNVDDHLLTVQANRLQAGQPDTELRSLSHLDEEDVKLLEHQVNAAHRALFEMDGKALLADEGVETVGVLREDDDSDVHVFDGRPEPVVEAVAAT